MSATMEAGGDALGILVARLRWPVPSVRLWAMQELALLVLDVDTRGRTERALVDELEVRRFEIEVVEVLAVFWLAKTKLCSYCPPANMGDHIRARSPLSDVFMRDLQPNATRFGEYSADIEEAPPGFTPTQDFLAAEGSHFPAVLRSELRWLEQRLWRPMQLQFAFEWHTSKDRVAHVGQWVDHFLAGAHGDSTGQFFTQQSARARSAYLRTLVVARERWGLAGRDADFFALSTLPIDPGTAWLTSSPPKLEIGLLGAASGESGLKEFIRGILTQSTGQGKLGAISFAHFVSDLEVVDVSIALWHGRGTPELPSVDADELDDDGLRLLGGTGLSLESTLKSSGPGQLPDSLNGMRCLSCKVASRRHGYVGADIVSRGLLAPRLPASGAVLDAHEENGVLHFRAGETTLGRCGYWNTHWQPGHPLSLRSRVGTYLWLTESGLSRLQGETLGRLFYVWRCRWLSRENSYSKYDVKDWAGVEETT